jgi:hypothetical protein
MCDDFDTVRTNLLCGKQTEGNVLLKRTARTDGNLMFVVPYILVTYVLFESNWMYNILFS